MTDRPLAIDLFSGLFGWSQGLIAEGWRTIGVDIEDMRAQFGFDPLPHTELMLRDVLTIHGSLFRDADLIVCSPPCQEFSYMAMPWSRGKAKAAAIRADATGKLRAKLTALFDACFRIQREASEAAGRWIPMIVENVRGAQEWVGRARWNFGSFYLWGDVPVLMPPVAKTRHLTNPEESGRKLPGFRFDGGGRSFQSASVDGVKQGSSSSTSRKFASAMIAKIPETLSRHIAYVMRPTK